MLEVNINLHLDLNEPLERLGLVERIGRPGDRYMDRYFLTPRTPKGQLLLHHFWRGDHDDDPHDHRWNFWTRPSVDYVELVMSKHTGKLLVNMVKAGQWTYRPYDHTHIVLGPASEYDYNWLKLWEDAPEESRPKPSTLTSRKPFRTLVWRTPQLRRAWGFWPVKPQGEMPWSTLQAGNRNWMDASEYFRQRGLNYDL